MKVSAYNKSKQFHIEDVEEPKVPRTRDTVMEEMTQENHEARTRDTVMEEMTQENHEDAPHEKNFLQEKNNMDT